MYDEESFPVEGVDSIKSAILETASQLNIDEDVIPKRFYGNIYSSVTGIENLVVNMTRTANPEDTPTNLTEDPIEIGFKEIANFSLDRIEVITP